MHFTVLTLFPDLIRPFFENSIMARSIREARVSYQILNIRDFSVNKHKTADDYPYGGGAGMVLTAEPLALALDSVEARKKKVVYLSPAGRVFNQAKAKSLATLDEVVLICGRYEGIDQRIIDEYVSEEISIGDYVLSSGETAALVVIDAIYRLLDGVINAESLVEESHELGLLEYPHYTRPEQFHGRNVPEVLLSGNHAAIEAWRFMQRVEKTLSMRPDLCGQARARLESILEAGDTLDPQRKKIYKEALFRLKNQGESHGSD